MNNLIIAGALFAYASVFLLGVDTRIVEPKIFVFLCYAKSWVLCMGFTLAFGSMFAKTWRVHSIFTNIRRETIKDLKLFGIVGGLLLVDGFILTAWAIISPYSFAVVELEKMKFQNALIIPELEYCHSDHALPFQILFIVTKGVLMLFGCFLAWETRAVNVPALNDSKYIGISVYIVVVMCIVGLSLNLILQDRLNEAFSLISLFIIFCTTLILGLVFAPKIVEIIRTPKGAEHQRYRYRKTGSSGMMKSIVDKDSTVSGGGPSRSNTTRNAQQGNGPGEACLTHETSMIMPEDLSKKIAHLEAENARLRQLLAAKSAELWNLLESIRAFNEGAASGKKRGGKHAKRSENKTFSGSGTSSSITAKNNNNNNNNNNQLATSATTAQNPASPGTEGTRRQSAMAGLFLSVKSHSGRLQLGRSSEKGSPRRLSEFT